MRCRPELAPRNLPWTTQDASSTLALQAARWLDEPSAWQGGNSNYSPSDSPSNTSSNTPSVSQLAKHLGVSDRHVRRIFETHFGVSPLQYLQTRRLLTAKQLLTDTDLPTSQIAIASGFGSVRRFSDAFLTHYRLNPSQLRKTVNHSDAKTEIDTNSRTLKAKSAAAYCSVKLSYRPPYDSQWKLDFFRKRQLNTTEFIATQAINTLILFTYSLKLGEKQYIGWLSVEFLSHQPIVLLKVSDSLRDVLPQVIRQVRALLDLDADPMAINAVLKNSFQSSDADYSGIRVPGCLNGFELAVRAILGQQVTVAAGRTFTQRVVDTFGSHIETPFPELTRLFPSAEVLASASGAALGQLGIVKQRQAAIVALARAVASQELVLHPGVNIEAAMIKLRELPGVGDWTAQYIAMRALRWPDAFVAGDVALHKAMGLQHQKPPQSPKLSPAKTAADAIQASQAWRPWRSYAVMRAWTSLSKSV